MNNAYFTPEDFVVNTSPRVPVCLCIDTSASMNKIIRGETRWTGEQVEKDGVLWNIVEGGESMLDDLNKGLGVFQRAILLNEQASLSCELSVVTFDDDVRTVRDFALIDENDVIRIDSSNTGNMTNMSKGVQYALDLLEGRKKLYKENGIEYFQPWLVLFTDGDPTDNVTRIQNKVREYETAGKLTVFLFALNDEVNISTLSGFSRRPPRKIFDGKIESAFEWLGKSVSEVSNSRLDEKITLNGDGIDDWSTI